jgi:hypothetical protein
MAFYTVRLFRRFRAHAFATQDIFSSGNKFEMRRIHASPVTAQVIGHFV